jgi:FKBP-type peptidyl-prolyl cis-trans isomerase FklB
MKKFSIALCSLCLSGFLVISCTGTAQTPKANLKSQQDSLAYAFGFSNFYDLKSRLSGQVDSVHIKDFMRGLLDGATIKDKSKQAYYMGISFGMQFEDNQFKKTNESIFKGDSTLYIPKDQFLAGIFAAINEDTLMNQMTAQVFIQSTMEKINAAAAEKEFASNKEAGIKFLEENKSKEGVVTLPSGLQYKVIKVGKGALPTLNDRVKVHYKGTLVDGTEFDSSLNGTSPEPRSFSVNGVIKGWTEALQLMPVGSKWELYIPQELAYGSQDRNVIKPFSTLVFELELLGIEPAK